MKLPEITQEILESFSEGECPLIEWKSRRYSAPEPQWTQAAVDFACLLDQCAEESICWHKLAVRSAEIIRLNAEIERMRPVVEAATAYGAAHKALLFYNKSGAYDYLFDEYSAARAALMREVMNFEAKKP